MTRAEDIAAAVELIERELPDWSYRVVSGWRAAFDPPVQTNIGQLPGIYAFPPRPLRPRALGGYPCARAEDGASFLAMARDVVAMGRAALEDASRYSADELRQPAPRPMATADELNYGVWR